MKKLLLLLIVLIISTSMFLPLVCYAETNYTVKFFVTATDFSSQSVAENGLVSVPTTPTKLGHAFRGWTLDDSVLNPSIVNITTYRITSDTNFYAVYSANNYKVSFRFYNEKGILTTDVQTVAFGGTAVAPEVPEEINGSIFNGWDKPLTTQISETTVFEAQYNELLYTVTYVGIEDEILGTADKSGLVDVIDYAAPEVEGQIFIGWSLTKDGRVLDTNYRINKDTTLYAVYGVDFWYWYSHLNIVYQILLPLAIILALSLITGLFKRRRRW